jgi:predicted AlkP superfamily pyrophosphatase or phosphodiesterase
LEISLRRCIRTLVVLLFTIVALFPTTMTRAAETSAPLAASDSIVVLISVDGLAAFYFNDPKAEMPTIRALAAQGAHASGMRAVTPTVTWPNHTTRVTGVVPARHGVVGNNYYDRATGERVQLIADPVFDKDQIVKTPTIYDVAKANGMRTAAIRWPATRNAKTLDWTIPDMGASPGLQQSSTPSVIAEGVEAGLWKSDSFTGKGSEKNWKPDDESSTRIFNLILQKHRPQFAMLHLVDVDHTQHQKGPRTPEAYEAIKKIDGQVREVWDELQRDFSGKATLVVVSDHGFSPIERAILPNVLLAKAGLVKAVGANGTRGPIQMVPQGGAALIYITDDANRAKLAGEIKTALAGLDELAKIVDTEHLKDYGVATPAEDPHAPDMILFADEGSFFGDTAAGIKPFIEKPERKGTHGHDPNLPHLQATFIAWGAGIKPGSKLGLIDNTAVAPTLASLLEIEMKDTDGKPLTEILAK